jgi:hypothetical protein
MNKIKPPHAFTWLAMPDLPPVPEHFIERGLRIIDDNITDFARNDKLGRDIYGIYSKRTRKLVKNQEEVDPVFQVSYDLGADWDQWVKDNITPKYYDTSVRTVASYAENATEQGPHTDGAKLKLYYLIDPGSADAMTSFYMQPGHPMVRVFDNEYDIIYADNIDDLVLLDQAHFPARTWILLNSYVIHGVEQAIVGRRTHISITFPADIISHSIRFK